MQRAALCLMAVCFLSGCGNSTASKLREQFVLDAAPDGAIVMSKVRKTLEEDDADEIDVVIRGRIYAGKESEPWEPGKASFILTDMAGHDGKSEHDPYACPFCSEKIEDYRAFVSFGEGSAADVDARELFSVKEMQSVYVKGKASLTESGDVLVTGSGIFISK